MTDPAEIPWRSYLRVDQPQDIALEGAPPTVPTVVTIVETEIAGRKILVGVCYGKMKRVGAAMGIKFPPYGVMVRERMQRMLPTPTHRYMIWVDRKNDIAQQMTEIFAEAPDGAMVIFACANDPLKGAILEALNVVDVRPPGEYKLETFNINAPRGTVH